MHLAVGKAFHHARVQGNRFRFLAERLVDVRGGITGSFDVWAGRIPLDDLLEIIQGLGVVVPVPQDLAYLVERLGSF